jgi:hypothetical protein
MNKVHLKVQSPVKIDMHLRMLLNYLDAVESEAVLLKYTNPLAFLPEPDECHFNVWLMINNAGGHAQSGWVLAQDKAQQFSEAIFHSVWRSPQGKLIDITPRKDREKRLLFVPDHKRQIVLSNHQGQPAIQTYDNVRLKDNLFITPLTPIKAVMQSDFVHRHHLWPW